MACFIQKGKSLGQVRAGIPWDRQAQDFNQISGLMAAEAPPKT